MGTSMYKGGVTKCGPIHNTKVYDTQIRLCDHPTLMRYLLAQSKTSIDNFKEKCMPYKTDHKYAMLRMEAFFVCVACEMLDVDNLLEIDGLGINSGLSTTLFSRYFNGEETKIYSIETKANSDVKSEIQERVINDQKPENSNLHFVDPVNGENSFNVAKGVIKKLNGYTGVFIDNCNGPKAYKFMDDLFCNENVIFCAIHDEGDKKGKLPKKYRDLAFYSGNDEFVRICSFLDEDLYNVLKSKRGNCRFALVDTLKRTEGKGFEVALFLNPKYKRR